MIPTYITCAKAGSGRYGGRAAQRARRRLPVPPAMTEKSPQTLWRWLCLRILTLAIGTVVLIALCMWLRFTVQYLWITHHMPPAVLHEFLALRAHPERDPRAFTRSSIAGGAYATPTRPLLPRTGSPSASGAGDHSVYCLFRAAPRARFLQFSQLRRAADR